MEKDKPIARRTRTIAISAALHDRLRMATLQESLHAKRRITLQDIAEIALQMYLDQLTSSPRANE
jgi:hypothetical protein